MGINYVWCKAKPCFFINHMMHVNSLFPWNDTDTKASQILWEWQIHLTFVYVVENVPFDWKNEKNENKGSERYSSIHVNFLHFTQPFFFFHWQMLKQGCFSLTSHSWMCIHTYTFKFVNFIICTLLANLSVLQVIMQQSSMRQDLLQFFTSLF